MTAREKSLRTQMRQRISQVCEGIGPVAKHVYYAPIYQKQKDQLAPKFPLKKLIDKEEINEIKQDITSGNSSDAADKLRAINVRLEQFEEKLDKRSSARNRRRKT